MARQGECYFCKGVVTDGDDGTFCSQCGTFGHFTCLKDKGLARERSGGLLSSGGLDVKCPSCGHEGSL